MEILLSELVGDAKELPAGVSVGEGPDAQTVRRIELAFEELAADVLNLLQLQQAGGGQERLHVRLFHQNVRGVAEVDQEFHSVLVYVSDGDFRLPRFGQLSGEHCAEIRTAR